MPKYTIIYDTKSLIVVGNLVWSHLWEDGNKCVLACFLKVSVLSTSLVFAGRLFHKVGAAATNALSPNVLVFITGWCSLFVSIWLVSRSVICSSSSSVRYRGASPWRTLKVRRRILYWIRFGTGSQWSLSSKTVSISSDGGVKVSILAAVLNIFWSLWCWASVIPYSVALQIYYK